MGKVTGSCLCGGVRLEIDGEMRPVSLCHCTQCRKQSGHYYAATNCQDDDLTITGEEHVKWYRSSDFAQRGFCSNCGSSLFWKPDGKDYTSILAGCLDNPTGITATRHIFVADKGDYYEINDDMPQYEQSDL